MASSSFDSAEEIFENAKTEFLRGLKNQKLALQLQSTRTIDDIWDFVEKLQPAQGSQGRLRGLRKIEPYLDRLQGYAGVVEVFVQVKPEILALIWGPIKLLLHISSNPEQYWQPVTFRVASANLRLGWETLFEALWPALRSKIEVIAKNIEKHGLLMCNEITMSDIMQAHDARLKAYKHYEETRDFQERQDFASMETYISPRFYDTELSYLNHSRCDGTGTWLLSDTSFCQWLDPVERSMKVLWLQGIPGAGKTYLSSMVVGKTKTQGHALFALLSYKHDSETPLPILHSLIFQLASQDRDLRTVLCSSIIGSSRELKRDLKGDMVFALGILSKLLRCAGPTCIIVDGVDEVAESTQTIILQKLLGVLKEFNEAKLLISSRREDKLERVLKDASTAIRVDQRNHGSIQTYINRQTQEWLEGSGFSDAAQSEIRQLLAPLAAKANGMFLYAKIVMESIEMLQDIRSIQNELAVLPDSLDEAYDRILQRINRLPPAVQRNSKRVLSWIACSSHLTRREVEQVLLIDPGSGTLPSVLTNLNVLQLCGPLVDVVDEQLIFVHFTVKEYLLSRHVDSFIDKVEAFIDLTLSCLWYLCHEIFDPDAADEEIEVNLLSGAYRLQNFAYSQWTTLMRQTISHFRDKRLPDQLVKLLQQFATDRENLEYKVQVKTGPGTRVPNLFEEWPEIWTILSRAFNFHYRLANSSDWRLDIDDSWAALDPTTMSTSVIRSHHALGQLVCPESGHRLDCHCTELQKHYGPRIFRCNFVACPFQRIAFQTDSLREHHMRHHSRPFKCPARTCEYSSLGFLSPSQCEAHWVRHHQGASDPGISASFDGLSDDEIQPLLFDLIGRDKTKELKPLLPHFHKLLDCDPTKHALWELAASSGSLAMAKLLSLNKCSGMMAFRESAVGNNVPVAKWLWETQVPALDYFHYSVSQAVMGSESADLFELWHDFLIKFGNFRSLLYNGIPRTLPNPVQETRLAAFWAELHLLCPFDERDLSEALKRVATNNCSSILATTLIKCGADVNYRIGAHHYTPLHLAARKTTEDAAYLVELLLLAGADPDKSTTIVRGKLRGTIVAPSAERGAKNISRWLGKTWDELVVWAREQRRLK